MCLARMMLSPKLLTWHIYFWEIALLGSRKRLHCQMIQLSVFTRINYLSTDIHNKKQHEIRNFTLTLEPETLESRSKAEKTRVFV